LVVCLVFVIVEIEALHPGKHLAATSLPCPHKVNLLADIEATRRSCSPVGIQPLEIAAHITFGQLVVRTKN